MAAWPASGNSNSTVTLNIPSGTAHWTSQLTVTVPAAVTTLIIQGATSVSCTGTAGTSGYACTPTDSTVIIDDIPAQFGVWQINGSSGTNPLIRFTGITIQGGTGLQKFQGLLLLYSNNSGSQLRIDHSHFNSTTYTGSGAGAWAGRVNSCFTGVIDHNVIDSASTTNTTSVVQGFFVANTCNDSSGYGDGSWATASGYGGSNFLFEESNVFNGGLMGDSDIGAKVVYRYNTINSSSQSSSWIHNHGTESNGGRVRGTRAMEIYQNYLHIASGSGSVLVGANGGSAMIWGNTVSSVTALFSGFDNERNDGGHHETATPNGWGFCGTATIDPNTGSPNGAGSAWDGNSNAGTGAPCLDGLGRGFTAQALNGQNFPSAANSITGTIAWPQQYLEPIYEWMNTLAGTPQATINSPAATLNRDVYVDNASFTGATGTGFGLLSARPTTCTAGPGGTYGTSPTGSYGVAYWATDTNTLYICTATNTWTAAYQPYTYPHPLVGGSTTYTLTVSAAHGSVSGTNSTSGSYASGTPIGPLTANPDPTYHFLGWSTSGSASCAGTGTCGPFNLNSTTLVTANFSINSWNLSSASAGTGSGTITCTPAVGVVTSGAAVSCAISAAAGSTITTVSGCGGTWSSSPYTFTMPNNDCTVTATFQGTVATPTFSPGAGSYNAAQAVIISDTTGGSSATVVDSMTETGNANDTLGSAPHRNTYTNCATGYSGGQLQPAGQPVGQLYCTAADKTAALANGGPNNGVVTSTISGTGTSALDNGNGAGGNDSATSVTATYAGTGTGCAVGTNVASTVVAGLALPGAVSGSQAVFGLTTATNPNTSMLSVTKYNSNADSGRFLAREDCASPNTTSVAGEHYEWDSNYTDSHGDYFGFGMHYDFTNSKLYVCPQGCSGWTAVELVPVSGGSTLTTYSWPAGDYLYSQRYDYWDAGCSYSGSNCAHYGQICLQLWNGGSAVNSLTCYNIQNASTHAQFSFTPLNKSTWTHPQYAPQHQWDINATSGTLTATVAFDSLVAYSLGGVSICYTTDGTTPTGDGSGHCTHGTLYTAPVSVNSNTTLKAIGTSPGYTDSAVASATYSFSCVNPSQLGPNYSGTYIVPPTTLPMTVGFTSPTSGCAMHYTSDGSAPTCSSTAYPGGNFAISAVGNYTYRVIACQSGYTPSGIIGGLWTVQNPSAVHVTLSGTQTFSGQGQNQ